jgi:hypothetical protein
MAQQVTAVETSDALPVEQPVERAIDLVYTEDEERIVTSNIVAIAKSDDPKMAMAAISAYKTLHQNKHGDASMKVSGGITFNISHYGSGASKLDYEPLPPQTGEFEDA